MGGESICRTRKWTPASRNSGQTTNVRPPPGEKDAGRAFAAHLPGTRVPELEPDERNGLRNHDGGRCRQVWSFRRFRIGRRTNRLLRLGFSRLDGGLQQF